MKKGNEQAKLSIVDAVNMLNTISELGDTGEIVKQLEREHIDWENVDLSDESTWLAQDGDKEKEKRVKEMFRVILSYLRDFYEENSGVLISPRNSTRIHNIMVLLGKATKKLEKYTNLFKGANKDFEHLQEWRDLQNFYQYEVVDPSKEQTTRSKVSRLWQSSFALKKTENKKASSVVENSQEIEGIDAIKQDTDYELFYLKKENRALFFKKDIVKDIQEYCRGDDFYEAAASDDPLLQVKNWHDKSLQVAAGTILKISEPLIRKFYAGMNTSHRRETAINLNKCLMALMLASNQRNLLRTFSRKSCYQYFRDFLGYLRDTLSAVDFINLCDKKQSRKKGSYAHVLWELPHYLCYALYTHTGHGDEMYQVIQKLCFTKQLTAEEKKELKGLEPMCKEIGSAHLLLERMLKSHPNGPIFKILDLFIEDHQEIFDPMLQDNVPQTLYQLKMGDRWITHMRLPSPTQQEYINKALINDEFRGFVRFLSESARKERVFVVNLQSRTDWKEYARSHSLEMLQNRAEFNDYLTVVTLPKNTDFYHQFAPYQDLDHAALFIDQFEEHLESETSGFYFPPRVHKEIFNGFSKELLKSIHEGFFDKKSMLSRKERLDFIEIAYTLLTLKIIEIENPTLFAFSCKDGLDNSLSMSSQFALFQSCLNHGQKPKFKISQVSQMLYTFPLFVRERSVLDERFYRMLHAVNQMEKVGKSIDLKKHFKGLFSEETLNFDAKFHL